MNNTVGWLLKVTGRKKLNILILTCIEAILGGMGVLYALLMKAVVDYAVKKNADAFLRAAVFLAALILARLAISAVVRWLREYSRSSIENHFKQRLTDHILRKEYACVSATHTAEWLNRLTNDTRIVADNLVDILPGLMGTAVSLFSAIVMILLLEPCFGWFLIPAGVFLTATASVFRGTLKRMHKEIQESDGKLRIHLQERIANLMLIKSFAAEDIISRETQENMRTHKMMRMRRSHFANFVNSGFGLIAEGLYLLGIIYCAHGIMEGRITYGTLLAVLQLIGQAQRPFAQITMYVPRWHAMTASAERLAEVESYADDPRKPFDLPDFSSLELEHVCFAYPALQGNGQGGVPVLKDLNLTIRKGDYAAFVGHSGCGKSTVLKLLMCMYPLDDGARWIVSGEEKTELMAAHRRLFAYVPQGNALMDGTVRDIVCFAHPHRKHDSERINRALAIACADEFVGDLDARLGERGSGMSEGQMQRLAIARAIFADAPVLLLDEATSALDEQTEKKLLENLRRLTDKTVILVTHRQAALSICNRVIRFSDCAAEEMALTQ